MTEIAETFRLESIERILTPWLRTQDSILEHDGILVIEGKFGQLQISRDQAELTVTQSIDKDYVKESMNAFNDIIDVQWREVPLPFFGDIRQIDIFLDDSSEGLLITDRERRRTPAIIGLTYRGPAGSLVIYTDFDCVQTMTETEFQHLVQPSYPMMRTESLMIP